MITTPDAEAVERFDLDAEEDSRAGVTHRSWIGSDRFRWKGRIVTPRRFVYEEFVGPVPEGAFVICSCSYEGCVQPEHLELRHRALRGSTEAQRFAERTEPDGACLVWTGRKTEPDWRPVFDVKRGGRWTSIPARRWAWEQAHGPIEDGSHVYRTCENPLCVNVEHLALRDMTERRKPEPPAPKERTCQRGHTTTEPSGCPECRRLLRETRRRHGAERHGHLFEPLGPYAR